ncbi:MAG: YgiT-type zinc finger protein [Nanoarchaeota archaeon]|nr:YgiT-type zinc finger protein [Nanoarchaeota archaeon]
MKKCPVCKQGNLEQTKNIILEIGGYVFIAKGHRCSKCGEEFPYEKETQDFIETARKMGVWPEPLKLYRHLSRSGKGLVFRIPTDLEKQLHLTDNTEIAITKLGNKIIIEPESVSEHKNI